MSAILGSLTDDLITAVAQVSPEQRQSPRVQNLKRRVEAALKPGAHGRTDQFEVARQLDGLQEKFQVLNRDELADALSGCLQELEDIRSASSWLPESLSLMLQLSDRPVLFSNIDELEKPVEEAPESESLTWSELNGQGTAFSNEDIWEEVNFADDSSEDDLLSVSSHSSSYQETPQTPQTLNDKEKEYTIPDDVFMSGKDEALIESIDRAQFWKPENHAPVTRGMENSPRLITELQLARETIFMLQGLPTSIFWRLDNKIAVDRSYKVAHFSNQALSSTLQFFTQIGTKVDVVRLFTRVPQTIPYMQTFCRGLEEHLLKFDATLSQAQCAYLSPDSTVSMLQLLDDVRQHCHDLVLLSNLILGLSQNSNEQPMRCLDSIYDLICSLEALGDENAFNALTTLFFSCFKTYTLSVQLWMKNGQIDTLNSAFFVRREPQNSELRTLWHDWYILDEGFRGQNTPRFLKPCVQKVFATGKNMVLLRHLNAIPELSESTEESERIFDQMEVEAFSPFSPPFSALVEAAFESLVNMNHSVSSSLSKTELGEKCGLWSAIEALEHVYLGKDLSILGTIDAKIFDLMDSGRSWDDKFLLTELTRSAFSVMPSIEPFRLVVRSESSSSCDPQDQRTVQILKNISIDYVLPWPVANIITQNEIYSYRRISTFLTQIRRAKYALVRQRIRGARQKSVHDEDGSLVHGIHHQLLWFLDSLYSHLTYPVITTTRKALRSALNSAEDVDAMITAHQSHMASLEEQCLLSDNLAPIHKAIINILDLCIRFADLQTVRWLETSGSGGMPGEASAALHPPKRQRDPDDSDYDSDDGDHDLEQTLTISFRESPYEHQMRKVKHESDYLMSFVADGLKGVLRADGLHSWNILAYRLDWR
ncbi:hypothetical protein N7495_001292 [Penicillium taxi]|uniref:uncharacterized protein n=1 Tax=Penicillium taxi TaxID=168475 RepID=UPI0025454260|nr:uncharacterized protein N7495_001292 [Penicillium taxi]KAJ5908610.1 hypothetical protein N7495_001292 [Penicillium taxi]